MTILDRIFGWLLVVGGLLHASGSWHAFHNDPPQLLWALSGSLAALLVAALNFLRVGRPTDRPLAWVSFAAPVRGNAVAVNSVTNKTYLTTCASLHSAVDGFVVVVDGATKTTSQITAGICPKAIAVNPVTNRIYVANIGDTPGFGVFGGGSITVIDGTNNSAVAISDPHAPWAVAVNSATNEIYVANSGNLTVIDGGAIPLTHTLGVLLAGTGTGTVTSNPAGIDCEYQVVPQPSLPVRGW